MKSQIKSVIVITAICAVAALLMAVTNSITAPIIAENDKQAANSSLTIVMPEGKSFEEIEFSDLPATVTNVYREASGGYVFRLVTNGYKSGLTIMCGVDASGTVTGATCVASSETLGYEKTYGDDLVGKTLDTVVEVDTVSKATKTTAAYKGAVEDALKAFAILGGAEIDVRSEEEILADALAQALPAGEGKFTEIFITEELTTVTAAYKADNGAGIVLVAGDQYVPADAEGNLIGEVWVEVAADAKKLIGSGLTIVEHVGLPSAVQEVSVTASGNYVFTLNASGYGKTGGDQYHPASGEYIVLKLAMTPAGKILDCVTVSQAESEGYGDACAKPSFYSQFDGRDQSNFKDIDAISGATKTTSGYLKAIERAYEALAMLKGEG